LEDPRQDWGVSEAEIGQAATEAVDLMWAGTPLPWTLAGSVPIRAIYERGRVSILPATAGPARSSTGRGVSRGMVR
jgi:hypothetical protein